MEALTSTVAGGGPTGLGICQPGQLQPQLDADGCEMQTKYCQTPIPAASVGTIAVGATVIIPVNTNSEVAFLTELVVHTPPALPGQILLNSLFVAAHNYFPDGGAFIERYQQPYEGGNLLPQNVRITAAVGARLSVTNNGTVAFQFASTFESSQLRYN